MYAILNSTNYNSIINLFRNTFKKAAVRFPFTSDLWNKPSANGSNNKWK